MEDMELPVCPSCGGQDLRRRGKTKKGLQRWFCRSCRLQFHLDARLELLTSLAASLLQDGVPVKVVCKAMNGELSMSTLYRIRIKNV